VPAVRRRLALVSVALAATVSLAYLPVLGADFINWDDPRYVLNNPHVRGLSWRTLTWAVTAFEAGNWHPLTWLSLALDYQMHGLRPHGYHLTSLALHVANSVLVLLVLHRLTGAVWRSAVVAALFGLHPLHVESVAWVTERKDVLVAFFWLLTMAAYARYARSPGWTSYLLVLLAFVMALLSKPMAITLPLALLLLDYWPLRRLSWRAVREKVPLVALVVVVSVLEVRAEVASGAVAIDPIPMGARAANAVVAYVKYLALTLWPLHLSPWYSHPALEGPPLSGWMVAGAASVLALATAFALGSARVRPYVAVGWVWYLATLLPVIGLLQVGRQGMADRYTYVPHLGVFIVSVWAVAELPIWSTGRARAAGFALAGVLFASLALLTLRQTRVWQDSMSFWTYTARMSPSSFVAHQALGGLLTSAGRIDEGIREYRRAAHLRRGVVEVHEELGFLLARKGQLGAAAAQYRKAIALRPQPAEDERALADVLLRAGHPVQARAHVEHALTLQPGSAEAHEILGRVLMAQGRPADAVPEFRAALRARPTFAEAQRNLGAALAEVERAGAPPP